MRQCPSCGKPGGRCEGQSPCGTAGGNYSKDPQACVRGSWGPHYQWDTDGGRIYTTALAVLTLEVYYRYQSERARVYTGDPAGGAGAGVKPPEKVAP